MKRTASMALAVALAVPAAAATAIFTPMRIIYPAQVWGVADDEPMMVQLINGMPSFRRPGDEQCLAKYSEGPVPCDEADMIEWGAPDPVLAPPGQGATVFVLDRPETPFAPPDTDPWCCYGGGERDPGNDPDPPVPAVPLPWTGALLIAAIAAVFLLPKRR